MRYISLCSGVEAASMAWLPLDWECVACAEFDDYPSAVLAAKFPDIPNLGDVTKVDWKKYHGAADLVIFGSPCQSFSVSGLRQGLDDPRGQLMLECLAACRDIDPEWVVFENVPGLLSADRGRCFATFLNAVAILWPDGGAAWRCLDAQWFGVAQRRRRVFAVINTRDWRRAAKVLLDENCLRGNPPTRGETRKDTASDAGRGSEGSCGTRAYGVRTGQTSANGCGFQEELTHTLGAADKDAVVYQDVIHDGDEAVNCFKWFAGAKARSMPAYEDGTTPTLTNSDSHQPAVAFAQNQRDEVRLVGGDWSIAGTVQSQVWGNHKNETLICQPKVMASGQANAEVATDMCPTIAARNYKDPPILVTDPIVIDRAAYNQGQNAQYPPHIEQTDLMDTLVARGPHAIAYSCQTDRR